MQWSHITALKATCPEDGDGTLDIVVSNLEFVAFCSYTYIIIFVVVLLWLCCFLFLFLYELLVFVVVVAIIFCGGVVCWLLLLLVLVVVLFVVVVIYLFIFVVDRSSIFETPNESDGLSSKFPHYASMCVVFLVFENDGMKPLMLKQSEPFSRPMNLGNYQRSTCLHVTRII
jgi:hypothetical protein